MIKFEFKQIIYTPPHHYHPVALVTTDSADVNTQTVNPQPQHVH
jgi:hypothetical protein